MLSRLTVIAFTAFAACSPLSDRVAMVPVSSAIELRPLVGSAMIRTVSLPTYAASEEIAVKTVDGRITIREDVLWADDPERAVTLTLTRTLSDILNTDVGPDPWPFVGLPDVSVDIRVERMIGGLDGTFALAGQFFVASEGASFRNSMHQFDIVEPVTDGSVEGIAEAQSRALLKLAEQIGAVLGR